MTIVLAVETSSEIASVALLCGPDVLSRQSAGVSTHSQTVLPMIQALLAEADLSVGRCDVIAFGAGPGSFTGVRTACGVAQGLAFGADLPVAPVVTLEAMALAGWRACPQATSVATLLDARMGEVYWAQYQGGEPLGVLVAPCLANPKDVRPYAGFALCGNAEAAYTEALQEIGLAASCRVECLPHAADIAHLGLALHRRHQTVGAEDAQPLYLRNKVARTIAEREAGTPA